jgi:hypothetical protein
MRIIESLVSPFWCFLLFFWLLLLLLFFCVPKGAPWSESGAFLFDQISLFGVDGVTLNNSQKTRTSTNCGKAEKQKPKPPPHSQCWEDGGFFQVVGWRPRERYRAEPREKNAVSHQTTTTHTHTHSVCLCSCWRASVVGS